MLQRRSDVNRRKFAAIYYDSGATFSITVAERDLEPCSLDIDEPNPNSLGILLEQCGKELQRLRCRYFTQGPRRIRRQAPAVARQRDFEDCRISKWSDYARERRQS